MEAGKVESIACFIASNRLHSGDKSSTCWEKSTTTAAAYNTNYSMKCHIMIIIIIIIHHDDDATTATTPRVLLPVSIPPTWLRLVYVHTHNGPPTIHVPLSAPPSAPQANTHRLSTAGTTTHSSSVHRLLPLLPTPAHLSGRLSSLLFASSGRTISELFRI